MFYRTVKVSVIARRCWQRIKDYLQAFRVVLGRAVNGPDRVRAIAAELSAPSKNWGEVPLSFIPMMANEENF